MPIDPKKKVQINITFPIAWKTELENLARIYSVEEGKTITFLDLIQRGPTIRARGPRDSGKVSAGR